MLQPQPGQAAQAGHLPAQALQVFPPKGGLLLHPHVLHHPRVSLGGHCHEGPLIGVGGPHQLGPAAPAAVLRPLLVGAGVELLAADGAHRPLHRAAHADLLLDPPLDGGDQLPVSLGAQEVGAALQIAVGLARLRHPALPHHLGSVDAGRLVPGAPLVVKQTAPAHKQGGQLLQGSGREPLVVPVDLIVAQPHREGVYLLRPQLFFAHGVDRF